MKSPIVVPDRAVVFVDGNNWYHTLRNTGLTELGKLNYAKIAIKLLGPRTWLAMRYYVGQVKQDNSMKVYADQRQFLSGLQATDSRITVHLGRLESRPRKNPVAEELSSYLGQLPARIDSGVFHDLMALAKKHERIDVLVEKAVDVHIAVDMVLMAAQDRYDAAYLLSADGDFTPAVEAVRGLGKKVYAASCGPGAQLATAVNSFIRLQKTWFDDCI